VFAADHAWAGEVEPVVQVHTAASGASCGYTFEEGTRYVVLGKRAGDYVETGLCSLTQPYNRDVIAQFEPITGRGVEIVQPPPADGPRNGSASVQPESATTSRELGAALGVTALLCLATIALSRRR
jgi:hypothetical protein